MRVWEIIRVIEDSPVKAESCDLYNVIFLTPDGHRFSAFFDCGEPDYIHWLDTPAGERIDFWPAHTSAETKIFEALSALACNLMALPHVRVRLLTAAQRLPDFESYGVTVQ